MRNYKEVIDNSINNNNEGIISLPYNVVEARAIALDPTKWGFAYDEVTMTYLRQIKGVYLIGDPYYHHVGYVRYMTRETGVYPVYEVWDLRKEFHKVGCPYWSNLYGCSFYEGVLKKDFYRGELNSLCGKEGKEITILLYEDGYIKSSLLPIGVVYNWILWLKKPENKEYRKPRFMAFLGESLGALALKGHDTLPLLEELISLQNRKRL